MNSNYDSKLQKLKARRQDPNDSIFKVELHEAYEKRSTNKATRYTLGAMQEVPPSYTANSFAQGERVKNQLEKGLTLVPVTFEYQGSVPLNVHIQSISDIDFLVLRSDFLTIDVSGIKNKNGEYTSWTGESGEKLLAILRSNCVSVLTSAFPEAKVNAKGTKSVSIEGGSLSRKVDVVPSHWHDTAKYQLSGAAKDRGVSILDTSISCTFKNFPFLHMHEINAKDLITDGGAKKAIRLLKTVKSDSERSDNIILSSYDIAGLVWNFNPIGLRVKSWNELSLLAIILTELTNMVANKANTMSLLTPDQTRCVVDTEEKFTSLIWLYVDVNALAEAVAQEILGQPMVLREQVQGALKEAYI